MLKAAVQASREKALKLHLERPFVVGITALTSDGKKDSMLEIVLERSELAKKVGYDGVVASVEEAQASGSNFLRKFFQENNDVNTSSRTDR